MVENALYGGVRMRRAGPPMPEPWLPSLTRDEQEDTARCCAYRSSDIERIRQVRRFAVGQGLT